MFQVTWLFLTNDSTLPHRSIVMQCSKLLMTLALEVLLLQQMTGIEQSVDVGELGKENTMDEKADCHRANVEQLKQIQVLTFLRRRASRDQNLVVATSWHSFFCSLSHNSLMWHKRINYKNGVKCGNNFSWVELTTILRKRDLLQNWKRKKRLRFLVARRVERKCHRRSDAT